MYKKNKRKKEKEKKKKRKRKKEWAPCDRRKQAWVTHNYSTHNYSTHNYSQLLTINSSQLL